MYKERVSLREIDNKLNEENAKALAMIYHHAKFKWVGNDELLITFVNMSTFGKAVYDSIVEQEGIKIDKTNGCSLLIKSEGYYESLEEERKMYILSMPYNHQLLTPMWKEKRQEVFKEQGEFCNRCKSKHKLHVHHKSYDRNTFPWDYPLENFEVLCELCHLKHHNRDYESNFNKAKESYLAKHGVKTKHASHILAVSRKIVDFYDDELISFIILNSFSRINENNIYFKIDKEIGKFLRAREYRFLRMDDKCTEMRMEYPKIYNYTRKK